MPALHQHQHNVASMDNTRNESNGCGSTTALALHYAAARGCLDCVRLLVDSAKTTRSSTTTASYTNEEEEYAIANTKMDNDVTPVYLAAQEGHLSVLKFLVLHAGGSLLIRAKDGMAPLHAASQMGCLPCVKWMVRERGIDPNLRDGDGATPLHFAASRGHLATVRWLLRNGARLGAVDRWGKSPLNDAAENQQVECLNILVQHGTNNGAEGPGMRTSSDYAEGESFYLHPPSQSGHTLPAIETPHAPHDGLYINPLTHANGNAGSPRNHKNGSTSDCDCSSSSSSSNSNSSSGSSGCAGGGSDMSFYLHDPRTEVIYNRVNEVFPHTLSRSACGLTVKVEVHSGTSSSPSNSSSEDDVSKIPLAAEQSKVVENDYEDIYNCQNVVVKLASCNEGVHEPSKEGKTKKQTISKTVSMPLPPPAPPLPNAAQPIAKPWAIKPKKTTATGSAGEQGKGAEMAGDHGPESIEIVEEPSVKPSDVVKGMCRSMTALSAKRLNSSCSDLTIISLDSCVNYEKIGPNEKLFQNLVKNERKPVRVLPSLPTNVRRVPSPPPLPAMPPPTLLAMNMSMENTLTRSCENLLDTRKLQKKKKDHQPLSTISVHDINSVQLRRTVTHSPMIKIELSGRTESNPLPERRGEDAHDQKARSLMYSPSQGFHSSKPGVAGNFQTEKSDLIAELKASKDITGIRRMKLEREKSVQMHEVDLFSDIRKEFDVNNFVEKVPTCDNSGTPIPAWKRQMLAKKAAERAKRERAEQMAKEAEEKRVAAMPPWKRQLLAKHKPTLRHTTSTPCISEPLVDYAEVFEQKSGSLIENGMETICPREHDNDEEEEDAQSESEEENIIPWRAQLRKTNSKLNLLE